MGKKCKRTLGFYLTLLILLMAACGKYEDSTPETPQGYEADTQGLEAEAPQGYGADVQNQETEASQGYGADVQDRETEVSRGHGADEQVWETEDSEEEVSAAAREDMVELPEPDGSEKLPIYGSYYYDLTNVVLYLEVYDELPSNYITKNEARKLGWEGGSVEKYREGAAIGGDSFGNREGLLPDSDGRSYTECDIDTDGYDSRGSRRLVFSNDGLYFYTSDHYESFSEVTVTEEYEVVW